MTEYRPLVNIAGEDQELPDGDTIAGVGTVGLAAVSRSHTSSQVLTSTPTNLAWNTERITLDPAYFATATDDDIEVKKTLNYLISVTAVPSGGSNDDVFLRLYKDGIAITGLVDNWRINAVTGGGMLHITTVLPLTAGERIGPRFNEAAGDAFSLEANGSQWTIVALEAAAGAGSGDFVGPASAVNSNLVGFDGTTGKLGKDSGIAAADVSGHIADIANPHGTTDALLTLAGVLGTPTYTTQAALRNTSGSTGVVSGGVVTDDADGTVTVAAVIGHIRATNSDVAAILSYDIAETPITPTDNDITYIYAEYNAGTPQIVGTITARTDVNTNNLLATVDRSAAVLHITQRQEYLGNTSQIVSQRLIATNNLSHESGLVTSGVGTRNIAITAGLVWLGLQQIAISAFDSSAAGTFFQFHRDGVGGWTDSVETQISNTVYDDNSGTPALLTGNRYGVHWVYSAVDDDVYVVLGRGDYTLAQARNAEPPGDVPPHIQEHHAAIIAKITVQKDSATFESVESAFGTKFSAAGISSHPDLANITANDHHDEAHTLESHLAVSTTGAQLDGHLASTANPHATDIENLGSGTLVELNAAITDATLDDSGDSRPPNGAAGGDLNGTYPNPSVDDGADGSAIHDNVNGEISAIADKALPTGSDHFIINDAAASNSPKSVEYRNLIPVIGVWPVDTALGTSTISSPVLTHPRVLRVRRIRAQFGAVTASGTYTFLVKSGTTLGTLATVGTVTVTTGNSSGASGAISESIAALNVTLVEMTTVGTHSGTALEQICTITAEAELD